MIVSIGDGAEEIRRVESERYGLAHSQEELPLSEHCRRVIRTIRDAQSIFIFGTARAKTELKAQMQETPEFRHRVVGTELAGSMTEV